MLHTAPYLYGRFGRISTGLLLLTAAAAGQPASFAPPQSVHTGLFPTWAVSGDFNKDGKLDLAVSNQNDNSILILLGRGDGTFQPGAVLSLLSSPYSIAVGDANNDGNADLFAVSVAASSLSVFLGRGDGTFQNSLNTPTVRTFPRNIATGDFNGDGKLDLAISSGAQTNGVAQVEISLGKGDGTLSPGGTYPAGASPSAIQTGDLNGDGRLDIVVEDVVSNSVYVLLGAAGGQFTALPAVATGPFAFGGGGSLALVDLNGDKRLDLIVGNTGARSLSIALGKGDGTFSPAASLPLDSNGSSFAAGDFNGDGKPDLAVVSNTNATVSVFPGKGDGTFLPALTFPGGSQPAFILAADLDRDGRIDLVTVDPFLPDLTVLRNTTGPTVPNGPSISLSSSQLQFALTPEGLPPAPQTVSITNGGGGVLAWAAAANVPWLLLTTSPQPPPPPPPSPLVTSGTAPSTLSIVANPNGLSPGVYRGAIAVTGTGAVNAPQSISVTLTLPPPTSTPPPQPFVTAVQNSASYSYEVAQGSIFIVKGANLGPAQLVQAPAGPLPLQLAGTSVQVSAGGVTVSCPLFYTSAFQVAAILPSSTPIGFGTVTVSVDGQTGYPGAIKVVSSGVGIYSVASSGMGSGIVTGLDYVTKTMAKPAKPGEVVIAWATGLGPITGNDATVSSAPQLFSNVEVLVGDQTAKVIGAGRSGCCAGLDQIAFQIPDAPKLGCFVPVSIREAGGAVSPAGSVSNFVTLPLSQSGEPCSIAAPGLPAPLLTKAASGAQIPMGIIAIGPGLIIRNIAPSLGPASLGSPRALAAQLSKLLHLAVPEADVVTLLTAYQSGDIAGARKILGRYGMALKNNKSARRLLRSATDLSQQQAAAAAFGAGSAIGLVAPQFASDFPPVGTCTIGQNIPADPSAKIARLDAGPNLTVTGPAGQKTMTQTSGGEYSALLGAGPSSTNTTSGFYTISGTGGKNIGPFSVSLNVGVPLTWTNKSAVSTIDRTRSLTLTWSGGAAAGHVVIGGIARASDAGAVFLCTEEVQKGTFTIPQFVLSALTGGRNATWFIAPHPLDNAVSIPGLDLALIADGSSDSRTEAVQ